MRILFLKMLFYSLCAQLPFSSAAVESQSHISYVCVCVRALTGYSTMNKLVRLLVWQTCIYYRMRSLQMFIVLIAEKAFGKKFASNKFIAPLKIHDKSAESDFAVFCWLLDACLNFFIYCLESITGKKSNRISKIGYYLLKMPNKSDKSRNLVHFTFYLSCETLTNNCKQHIKIHIWFEYNLYWQFVMFYSVGENPERDPKLKDKKYQATFQYGGSRWSFW